MGCGGPSVKYRFSCCREQYCSLDCYRTHATMACAGRAAADEAREAKQRRKAEEEKKEEEDDEEILSEVRLCGLRGNASIRQALRSREFRDVLWALDRADDRRAALESLLERDAYFARFVDNMMESIDMYTVPR